MLSHVHLTLQRVWLITAWAADEQSKLKVLECIEEIDWRADEFVLTGRHGQLHPSVAALLVNHGRQLKLYQTNLFAMDRQAALDMELR